MFSINNINGIIEKSKVETKIIDNYIKKPICDELVLSKASNKTPSSLGGKLTSFIISNLMPHSSAASTAASKCTSELISKDLNASSCVKSISKDSEKIVNAELNSNLVPHSAAGSSPPSKCSPFEVVTQKAEKRAVNSVEPLTKEKRLEILKSLNLTDDSKAITDRLEKYDDDTFLRTVELIKNNGECSRHSDFSKIQELSQEEFEKTKNFLAAGNNSFYIPYACDFAKLEDDKYEKLLNFRTFGGNIKGSNAQELYNLNDSQFDKALSLIPHLRNDEYITPIAVDDNYYENVKNLLETPVFEKLCSFQDKYQFISDTCNQDEESVKLLIELVNNGYRVTKDECHDGSYIEEFKNMSKDQRNRAIEVTNRSLASELPTICEMAELKDNAYQRAVELRNLNIEENKACTFSQYDKKPYSRILELINKGVDPNSIDYRIENLSDEEYEKITKSADAGVKKFFEAVNLNKEDGETYSKALKMASYKVPGYDFIKGSKSSDYEHELEKLEVLSSNLSFKKMNNTAKELPQISEEEKSDIVKLLNKENVYVHNDMSAEQLASAWKDKYIEGVNALPNKYVNKLMPYTCSNYKSPDCEPLARWMYIKDLDDFISKFPKEGEIYQTPGIQSFAKTQRGAEQKRGNNFSDTNSNKNVKFIVYPKSETTQAFDTGEGKYGSDEAIYKANQKFKVLYNETQDLKTHKLYTIYMQEV